MSASRLSSNNGRKGRRKKDKGSTTRSVAVNHQRLPFLDFFAVFFAAMVGLTPPRGQAPVDVIDVHVSTLKHALGIPRRRRKRRSEALRRFAPCRSGRNE